MFKFSGGSRIAILFSFEATFDATRILRTLAAGGGADDQRVCNSLWVVSLANKEFLHS